MTALRILVVDDEPVARQLLRDYLGGLSDVDVVGECADGTAALDAVRSLRPDLVLLDVQMPGLDGFEVVERLTPDERPAIVFVTAHDEHAVHAFDVHAVDYLLKPVDEERLAEAVRRGRELARPRGWRGLQSRLEGLLGERTQGRGGAEWLLVRDGDQRVPLRWEEIVWIEAAANYARVHAGGRVFLMRATLTELEERLRALPFARIHRQTLVNVSRIVSIQPCGHGDHAVLVAGGERLLLSRRYRSRLEEIVGRLR